MKKITGIILCAVIVITAVFSLTSCSKSDAEKIVGKWASNIDMTETFAKESEGLEEIGLSFKNIKDLNVTVLVDFTKDGTFKSSFDEASLADLNAKLKTAIKGMFEDAFKAGAEAMGMSVEEYMAIAGVSIDDIVNQSLVEQPTDDESKGKYKVENGKLFMVKESEEFKDDQYYKYEFSGSNQLQITSYEGAEGTDTMSFNIFPMVFNKK